MEAVANESDLLARCRAGHEEAWGRLYSICIRLIWGRILRMGFTTTEAQDVCQDVMVALARNIETVRNPEAFVQTVCHRRCVDLIRCRRHEDSYDAATAEGPQGTSVNLARQEIERWVRDSRSQDSAEAGIEALSLLRDHLDATAEPCKTLLRRRFYEDLPYKDVAALGGIPELQVGVYINRCVKRLKARLQSQKELWARLSDLWAAMG